MRFLAVTTCTMLATWGLYACSGQGGSPSTTSQVGGASSTTSSSSNSGGNSASSSSTAKGGAATGGTSSGSGGTSSAQGGSSVGNGGTVAQGGSSKASSGGSTATSSGGTTAKGGTSNGSAGSAAKGGNAIASAGMSAKGGGSATANGGTTARGGASSTAAGGSTARGGTSASGGSSPTGGTTATGGTTGGGVTLPPITNGQNGTTTRYWDCCMPSCSWKANASGKNPVKVCGKDGTSTVSEANRNACDGGSGYMCYWGAPWSVSSTVSYGYAAYNGVACGTCYQLDFTDGAAKGKSMIVQVINIGGLSGGQFDLLIPGGGVGAMNACNANGNMWNGLDLGSQFGGLLASCGGKCDCLKQKCQTAFSSNKAMLDGCNWFSDWFQCADNPKIVYKQTSCPSDITNKSGITG